MNTTQDGLNPAKRQEISPEFPVNENLSDEVQMSVRLRLFIQLTHRYSSIQFTTVMRAVFPLFTSKLLRISLDLFSRTAAINPALCVVFHINFFLIYQQLNPLCTDLINKTPSNSCCCRRLLMSDQTIFSRKKRTLFIFCEFKLDSYGWWNTSCLTIV